MRDSLRGVRRRVDRLATRVLPSPSEQLDRMSTDELMDHMLVTVAKCGGLEACVAEGLLSSDGVISLLRAHRDRHQS